MNIGTDPKQLLANKQLHFLSHYLPSTIISLFLAISLTTWLVWANSGNHNLLIFWYAGNILLLAFRSYIYRFYIPKNENQQTERCILLLTGSAIVNGFLIVLLIFIIPNDPIVWTYIELLISIMIISSIVTLGAKLGAFLGFLVASCLPLLVFQLSQVEPIDYFHLTIVAIVLMFIINAAWRFHHSIMSVFLMEIENTKLKHELNTETSKKQSVQSKLQEKAQELQELNNNLETKVTEKTKELNVVAFYDQLTQLPNRHSFYSFLQRTIARHIHSQTVFSLFFIDLDGFKDINDNLGHDMGDKLLIQVAERLKLCVRVEDFIARVGGDEFSIVLKTEMVKSHLSAIADKIINAISKPYQLGDNQSYISCSIGISSFPHDGDDIHQLIKHADLSMYQAKENGKNGYHFFNIDLYEKKARRFVIENQLKSAIKTNELSLVYQPQVDMSNNQVENMEALLRWHNKELGFVSPADFIPIAEDSNLILDLGDWVLDQALVQVKQWNQQLQHPIRVAVNISGMHFKQNDFADYVENKLKHWQVHGSLLEIELTESSIMDNTSASIKKLAQLKYLGVHTSIDDFGTGYSSMSYLKQLPIDKLKIDKSFIDGIPHDQHNMAITAAIIELARQFNLVTIAEGVEEQEQRDILKKIGCHFIQGYYYYKPLTPVQFEESFLIKSVVNE